MFSARAGMNRTSPQRETFEVDVGGRRRRVQHGHHSRSAQNPDVGDYEQMFEEIADQRRKK